MLRKWWWSGREWYFVARNLHALPACAPINEIIMMIIANRHHLRRHHSAHAHQCPGEHELLCSHDQLDGQLQWRIWANFSIKVNHWVFWFRCFFKIKFPFYLTVIACPTRLKWNGKQSECRHPSRRMPSHCTTCSRTPSTSSKCLPPIVLAMGFLPLPFVPQREVSELKIVVVLEWISSFCSFPLPNSVELWREGLSNRCIGSHVHSYCAKTFR